MFQKTKDPFFLSEAIQIVSLQRLAYKTKYRAAKSGKPSVIAEQ